MSPKSKKQFWTVKRLTEVYIKKTKQKLKELILAKIDSNQATPNQKGLQVLHQQELKERLLQSKRRKQDKEIRLCAVA